MLLFQLNKPILPQAERNNLADFDFKVNLDRVAVQLQQKRETIEGRITQEVRQLSVATHAHVVSTAQEKLTGFKRDFFFGGNKQGQPNVRWVEVSQGLWIVELDDSVQWIEEGRESVFMDWLLKGPGVKTAKDGSRYRSIPIGQSRGVGGKKPNKEPVLQVMIQGALKREGISLNKLDRDVGGEPKLGIVGKLDISIAHRTPDHDKFFSKPRTNETARRIGLEPHNGHFFLKNAVVMQREINDGGRKRVSKEVVTFRTISSKHEQEHRWFSPKVEALNSIPEAYAWAESQWEAILKGLEEEFNKAGET